MEAVFRYRRDYEFKSWFRCPSNKVVLVYRHPTERKTNYLLSSNTNLHNELAHKPGVKNILVVCENISPEKTDTYERVPLSQFINNLKLFLYHLQQNILSIILQGEMIDESFYK